MGHYETIVPEKNRISGSKSQVEFPIREALMKKAGPPDRPFIIFVPFVPSLFPFSWWLRVFVRSCRQEMNQSSFWISSAHADFGCSPTFDETTFPSRSIRKVVGMLRTPP